MIKQTDFPRLVEQAMSLPGRANMRPVIEKELLHYEMKRFIPMDVQERTLLKNKFYDFLTQEIRGLLSDVQRQLMGGAEDEFRM